MNHQFKPFLYKDILIVLQETVARAEYDRLMSAHNEEMEMLQGDYE